MLDYNSLLGVPCQLLPGTKYQQSCVNFTIYVVTRTAWAVFKYCGTKTVPLRMKKKIMKILIKNLYQKNNQKGVRIRYK